MIKKRKQYSPEFKAKVALAALKNEESTPFRPPPEAKATQGRLCEPGKLFERQRVLAGDLDVLLPGSKGWKTIKGGEAFEVPAQSKFNLKIKTLTDYCCSFIP